jgi:hypothetical protein
MNLREYALLALALVLSLASPALAADLSAPTPVPTPMEGFGNPYDLEKKAFGYDPRSGGRKADPAEDFQIIFITSAPFTALASYGITGLVSLAVRDSFSVEGDYLIPFIAGTVAGSAVIASVSVLSNKYPPPSVSLGPPGRLVLTVPLVQARF